MNTTQATTPTTQDRLTQLLEHADWLHGLALRLVRDGNEAEDVLQEALLAASGSSVPRGVPDRVWLGGILKNVARGRRRKGRNRSERERMVAVESDRATGGRATKSTAEQVGQIENQRRLLDHVESLPEAQRGAVLARFYEGLPPRKIAQRHGVPVSTINSRIQRGLETLRQHLDAEHGDRRTWAVWILPLARGGHASKLPAMLGGVLTAAAALVVLGGAWMWIDSQASHGGAGEPAASVSIASLDPEEGPDLQRESVSASTDREVIKVTAAPITPVVESAEPEGPRLNVRVVDPSGGAIASGLVVGANTFVDLSTSPGRMSNSMEGVVTHSLEDGMATFTNPWQDIQYHGVDKGPDTWELFEILQVYIEGPGLAEFEPGAAKEVAFYPLKPGPPQDMECTLTLPPRGTLRLEVYDVEGKRLAASGTATLKFPGTPQHPLGGEKAYLAPIGAGVAEWSDFVTGGRHFEVRVNLPALGSTWTLEGVGPEQSTEIVTIKALQPRRPAITARVVDETGEPLELDWLDLTLSSPDLAPYVGRRSIRASSDENGAVRFELPVSEASKGPLPALSIRTMKTELVGSDGDYRVGLFDAIHLEERPGGMYELGADLGEVVLGFEPRTELSGQVLDIDGAPIAGAEVTVETPGASGQVGPPTDASGAFAMAAPVRDGSKLRVAVPGEAYTVHVEPLPRGVNEITVVLERGASFHGKIDMGGLPLPERAISVILEHETDSDVRRYYWPDKAGSFGGGPVPPGDYTAIVRHQGGQVITAVTGIQVGESGRVTDERLNGLRLSDHFRLVQATWMGTELPYSPQYVVYPHDLTKPNTFILIGDLEDGLILPTQLGAAVTFRIGDSHLRVEDVTTIGDAFEVYFGEAIEVSLLIEGVPGVTKEYVLRGEPGSNADGYFATLSHEALRSGNVKVSVPSPGSYRLHVGERPRVGYGGVSFQVTGSEPLGAPFEVLPHEDGGNHQEVPISL